jgi:hypothetical protein
MHAKDSLSQNMSLKLWELMGCSSVSWWPVTSGLVQHGYSVDRIKENHLLDTN